MSTETTDDLATDLTAQLAQAQDLQSETGQTLTAMRNSLHHQHRIRRALAEATEEGFAHEGRCLAALDAQTDVFARATAYAQTAAGWVEAVRSILKSLPEDWLDIRPEIDAIGEYGTAWGRIADSAKTAAEGQSKAEAVDAALLGLLPTV